MYFRQLRYFVTVAHAGSFMAAARLLHVSQPALGQQVKALEEHLGVHLLERHSRGVMLSDGGRIFLACAEDILARVNDAEHALDRFRVQPATNVIIGVTPTPGRVLLPYLLSDFDSTPQLRIRVQPGLSRELARQVAAKEIDLALCYEAVETGRVRVFPLYSEDLFLVGPPALVRQGEIPFRALADFSLVLDNHSQASRALLERIAQEERVCLTVSHEVEPINLKREMLLHHGRCSIVPYGLFQDEIRAGQLAARHIVEPAVTRTLSLLTHDGLSRVAAEFILSRFRLIVSDLIRRGELGWQAA